MFVHGRAGERTFQGIQACSDYSAIRVIRTPRTGAAGQLVILVPW